MFAEAVIIEKLLDRSIPEANTGCWLWLSRLNAEGYPCVRVPHPDHDGQSWPMLAHRVAYSALKGEIPEGATLDHLCRTRSYINPDHLEPVSIRVNVLRGDAVSAANAKREACINGHPFDVQNTKIWRDGRTGGKHRKCRTCQQDWEWNHRQAIK